MSNKNPFEIRTEVLAMAKDYLDKQYELNIEFTKSLVEQGKAAAEDFQKATQLYSTEELMEKAQEFYSFVTKKD